MYEWILVNAFIGSGENAVKEHMFLYTEQSSLCAYFSCSVLFLSSY